MIRTRTPAIFVSYRHGDSAGYAGHLFADLRDRYGAGRVFEDVDSIEPGATFPAFIDHVLESCQVLIAVIGRSWLAAPDSKGRRLDDPTDWVRIEIAAALRRNIPVIPVLVGGAAMPQAAELPTVLAALANRQAIEISDSRWDYDIARLFEVLDRRVGPALPVTTGSVVGSGTAGGSGKLIGSLIALAVVIVFGGGGVWLLVHTVSSGTSPGFFGSPPTLSVSPATAPRGATITVSGTGFQPGETVDVYVHATLVGMAKTDGEGAFSKGFTVPASAPPPDFPTTVHATGESSVRTAQAPFSTRAP